MKRRRFRSGHRTKCQVCGMEMITSCKRCAALRAKRPTKLSYRDIEARRNAAIELRAQGLTLHEIDARLGLGKGRASMILRRYNARLEAAR